MHGQSRALALDINKPVHDRASQRAGHLLFRHPEFGLEVLV